MNRNYILQRDARDNPECIVQVGRRMTPLLPDDSLKVRNHSPDGFEFGYAGSGPAQLALAILLDYCRAKGLKDRLALDRYQWFKQVYIATAGQHGCTIDDQAIRLFLESPDAMHPSEP